MNRFCQFCVILLEITNVFYNMYLLNIVIISRVVPGESFRSGVDCVLKVVNFTSPKL